MSELMKFAETGEVVVRRNGRILVAELKRAHRVLSTCHVNGGQRDDLTTLVNHQSCEGRGHWEREMCLVKMGSGPYHHAFCESWDLRPSETALMATAANMDYAAIAQESFRDIEVTAIVTGGVEGNAICPGDPANWYEVDGKYEKVGEVPGPRAGTINTLLFFNCELSEAALARSVLTMCEAKSAALTTYAVSSKFSQHLATGTGTDQYCIAAPLEAGFRATWTGQHTRLGEIIGRVVKAAVKETLRWQNGLEASMTRSVIYALRRYGLTEVFLKDYVETHADAQLSEFFMKNWMAVIHDPQAAACAYGIASIRDRIEYAVLPESLGRSVIASQCALLASSLAAKPQSYGDAHRVFTELGEKDLSVMVAEALLLGLKLKWSE